jgi:hypothetical protein
LQETQRSPDSQGIANIPLLRPISARSRGHLHSNATCHLMETEMSLENLLARLGLKKQDAIVDERFERRIATLGRKVPAALPSAGRSAFKFQY